MSQNQKQSSPALKILALCLVMLLLGAGLILLYNYNKKTGVFSGNKTEVNDSTTIIYNEENIYVTEIKPGRYSFGDAVVIVGIVIGVLAFLSFLVWIWFKTEKKNKEINYEKMVTETVKKLKESGHDIGFEKPKWEFPYFGVDDNKNPLMAFIFYNKDVEPNSKIEEVPKFNLISCSVDVKNLQVFNTSTNRGVKEFLNELHDQRFGKLGVPNKPGKTEKEPTMFADMMNPNASINIPLGDQDEE